MTETLEKVLKKMLLERCQQPLFQSFFLTKAFKNQNKVKTEEEKNKNR